MANARSVAAATLIIWLVSAAPVQGEDPALFLRFAGRADHVELEKSRGALDLKKPFTIEWWGRWDTNVLTPMHLAGDEAWDGMSEAIPVDAPCGWVIRTSKIKDANKQTIEFNVGAIDQGKKIWFSVSTPYEQIKPEQWQHIAVCRTATDLRIYWNGKLAAKKAIGTVTLQSAPTNVFLGVRKNAWNDRNFVGDICGFRMSNTVRYTKDFVPSMTFRTDEQTTAALDFSAEDGKTIPDISDNKRHGMIVGAKLISQKKD